MNKESKILVVDDEAVMRDGCQRILAKGGCEVISACNGEEGLAAIQEDPRGFGVVLLDLKMPGMSGIEVLEAARDINPDLLIVVITGYATVEVAREALAKGAELIEKAKVTKVILEAKSAVGVEYRKKGKTAQVFAPTTVISAGGIGSPVILRASGIERAGYDFFFDPLIGVRGTVNDIEVPFSEIPMSCGVHMEDEGYLMTDMSHPFATTAAFAAGVLRLHKMFSRPRTLQIMVKAKDELGGSLTDRGGIRKILDENEKRKLRRGYERAKEILKNAGAKGIFKTGYFAAHPGGSAKVGDIVDSNLKTEYENLYVCDCSVIPEAWGIPPTATIIALGKRLAKQLSGE